MLDRIFKPAWQSASADKRLKSIKEMGADTAETNKVLFELAKNDVDSSVRLAAIEKLQDLALLAELSQTCSDSDAIEAVAKQLDAVVCELPVQHKSDSQSLMARFPALKPRFAAHAPFADLRLQALESLSDKQYLEVLGNTGYMDCRQYIAEHLSNVDDIEAARKILRGKDKKAERIVKNRIDAHRQHQRQLAEQKEQVEKLVNEAEYLSAHDWLPEFTARCGILRQQWASIDFPVEESERSRFQAAQRKLEELLQQQELIEQARLSQQQAVEHMDDLFANIAALGEDRLTGEMDEISAGLKRQILDWAALGETVHPDESMNRSLQAKFEAAKALLALAAEVNQIRQRDEEVSELVENEVIQLESLIKKFRWPDNFSEPVLVADLKKRLGDWRDKQHKEAQQHRQKLDRIHRNINRIFHLSRAGNLAGAKHAVDKVRKSLAEVEENERAALQERFDEAVKTLDEMGDWKNYATEPKYLELCESMESLIDSSATEEKRYQQMQELQKQWKALGYSEVSDQYWPRFKLAADKVYQPCAEHFQKRREIQKANLEKRQQFVEQMRSLLEDTDWDNDPDYKAAQSQYYEISQRFTGVKDVEHKPGQKQWRQFKALKDQLKTRLAVAYDENIETKRRLVTQARQLAENTDGVENLDRLKSLQSRWSQVGITRRKQDQKAWAEFKKYCDSVYEQVQQLRRHVRKENDQQLDNYRRIIKSIRQLAETAGAEADSDQQFRQLQEDYRQLPDLPAEIPRKLSEAIQRDFDKACRQFEDSQQRICDVEKARQIERLRSKARLCAQQEALGLSPSVTDLEAIDRQWQDIELQDATLSGRIEARRQSANTNIDRAAIGEQRRLMCIQLEIALGVDSPDDDRELRMQYQLEQMNQSGLGQNTGHDGAWFDEIELQWLCMPGALPEVQELLDERFQQLIRSRSG